MREIIRGGGQGRVTILGQAYIHLWQCGYSCTRAQAARDLFGRAVAETVLFPGTDVAFSGERGGRHWGGCLLGDSGFQSAQGFPFREGCVRCFAPRCMWSFLREVAGSMKIFGGKVEWENE